MTLQFFDCVYVWYHAASRPDILAMIQTRNFLPSLSSVYHNSCHGHFCCLSCSLISRLQLHRSLVPHSLDIQSNTHYRLGKNLPGSGNRSRCSRFALSVHVAAVMATTMPDMIAVLAFQFAGWLYQPPAGDQTCFGYLGTQSVTFTSTGFRTRLTALSTW